MIPGGTLQAGRGSRLTDSPFFWAFDILETET